MSRPVATAPLVGATAPSVALPLMFTLTGLLALCVGIVWLVVQPSILATYHYNQNVIAATHLFVLGWICSVVMGAMYQLVPVALETKLYSEKLARWQFAFHLVGFIGMVWMFRVWNMEQVGHFGSVLGVGVALFVYNIARTLWRVPKWNVTATSVSAALAWISLTVILGLSIAVAKSSNEYESGPQAPPHRDRRRAPTWSEIRDGVSKTFRGYQHDARSCAPGWRGFLHDAHRRGVLQTHPDVHT